MLPFLLCVIMIIIAIPAKTLANPSARSDWQKTNGVWYYYNSNGSKHTGWLKDGNNWYYLSPSGVMLTGWQQIGNNWYYLNSSGAMLTGWQKIGGTWYYMNSSGAMLTGWQKIGGTWYYLKSSGAMAANEWCGGYWLNANGAWTYQPKGSWKKDGVGWWFGDASGWYAKNQTIKIDDVYYAFDYRGYWNAGSSSGSGSGSSYYTGPYVLNTNSLKFHRITCASVSKISPNNRMDSSESRDTIISWGYIPCQNCNP